jgi:RsmE family RNA methyltransferase
MGPTATGIFSNVKLPRNAGKTASSTSLKPSDLRAPQRLPEAFKMIDEGRGKRSVRILADPGGSAVAKFLQATNPIERVDCFIGPPGGFSPDELKRFSTEGFQFVKVAQYRLRTELAAIVLCAEVRQNFIT